MDKRLQKYILMNDRVGEHLDKGWITSKSIPTQLLRGDIFEALPESEQPQNPEEIALQAISMPEHSIKLKCPTLEVSKITDSEADLLLAITSREERFRSYKERNRLDKGKSLKVSSQVFVKVKSSTKELPGVIWYKGPLPTHSGTMFGVELLGKESEGCGTCDGTFRNKRYFTCPQDRGVFVALDKLHPGHDQDKSPKKETTILTAIKDMMPSFSSKDTSAVRNMAKEHKLKIDQRVVVFPEGSGPLRGTVRYISEKIDSDGDCPVGIELDKRKRGAGMAGTGMFMGKQRFVCQPGYALFAPVTTIIPEEEYHPVTDRLAKSDGLSASLSYLEANSGYRRNENEGFKRSNSATSISSKSSEEAFVIAGGKEQNKEKICEEQTKILKDIQARQRSKADTSNHIDGTEEPVSHEHMSFHAEHFKKSPGVNSEWMSHTAGKSKFYHPSEDMPEPCQEETPHGSATGFQSYSNNVAPESNVKNVHLSRSESGSKEAQIIDSRPTSSTDSSQIPSWVYTQESINSSGGVNQYKTTHVMQNDIEMKDHQLGAGVVHGEERSKPIDSGLEVGSMVEVPLMGDKGAQYGVIRWIGKLPELPGKIVAGLELETEQPACSDGVFGGKRYFTCLPGRAFFVYLQNCKRDSRFQAESPGTPKFSGRAFGSIESPAVTGTVPPPNRLTRQNQGRMKGIQGHHNSCYLDATLYSMFSFSTVFDSLLHREKNPDDLEQYDAVQRVLKEHIVNPLRNGGFVRADHVLKLRSLLDELGSTSGLMNEEKDPEEFLNTLLHQVLKSDALLKLKTPNNETQETNYYQIITEKDDTKKSQPVQKLLEQSFLFSDLKLAEVPSCLILQMPRFGKRYKMYDFILPNLKLDITHILENGKIMSKTSAESAITIDLNHDEISCLWYHNLFELPFDIHMLISPENSKTITVIFKKTKEATEKVPRECSVCGRVSTYECKDCYPEKHELSNLSYCDDCVKRFHSKRERTSHQCKPIAVPRGFSQRSYEQVHLPTETMDLFAVVCIATSHYVAFVKCGTSDDSEWCFFDSMADRKGETNGYNIPMVTPCPEAREWLSKKDDDIVRASEQGQLPSTMKRLFGDAYMCLYQNLEMTMYK